MPQARNTFIGWIVLIGIFSSCTQDRKNSESLWEVPESAQRRSDPLPVSETHLMEGRQLFQLYCESCHGASGRGDGAAGQAMGSQPADLHSDPVQSQSDGVLFYKISEGRGIMPSFKEIMTEKQRWQLVRHLRNLGNTQTVADSTNIPQPLVPELSITRWAKVAPRAVRIWESRNGNYLWYATLRGEVYRLSIEFPQVSEKMLDVEAHGIPRLQGATMWNDTLYLSGNTPLNEGKGTAGRMIRVFWNDEGDRIEEVVFTTETYGTTNTPFDHGWSALQVSQDGQSIYVVSGSRTDHGEVQDNLGAYPYSRDEALTAKIFEIPIQSKKLFLPNDLEKLKAMGVLFAEGIRNAYDLALDKQGRLFAVVNSGDYDQNEDMFWVQKGRHYGYPWMMGGLLTPQQFEDWRPDPTTDPFLNQGAAAWPDDFYNDPDFPEVPEGVTFSPGIVNYGPDADNFRDPDSGLIRDASELGIGMTTFTPHSSPLGLVFDRRDQLPGRFKGKALALRYTSGQRSVLMQPFTQDGEDLLLLDLRFDAGKNNFNLHTYRVAAGFSQPVDAVLVGESLFVIEYGGREKGGNIWKVTFK
ncbi:c-type cytochrome [Cyclobacterium jeungdonense]|uniref:C-type cytochrome n=1 Tax=Cyclobacterium jeungdonense TaxID=708087 RepID=A0ABT8CFI6_9BACT|nr:c-type cytochrome [Cyclobacterium jeungdonense]MDN3690436.1 c-type cytochrome [Cyclobacterium jeungdonense]